MSQIIKLKKLLVFKKLHLLLMWFFILTGININIDHFYIGTFDNTIDTLVYLSYSFRLYIQFLILFFLLFLNFKENLKFIEINNFF